MIKFPFETPALRVTQPIGTFYVAVLPAELLLQVASSDVMSATINPDGDGYVLTGTQRLIQDKRLTQIADYIDRFDSAFPNSIILAANYDLNVGMDQDEIEAMESEAQEQRESERGEVTIATTELVETPAWTVSDEQQGCFRLRIPTSKKLAAIIDGQHRLFAFTKADKHTRLDMQLVCAIILDLPKPIQAQLFATINSTQKPVDRSLTFELFGYNVADEPEEYWTPDKIAVFLTRKLSTEESSPLKGKITVAPKRDSSLLTLNAGASWRVSTAVIVDGILRLISTNPKRDANEMRTPRVRPRSTLRGAGRDKSPLRDVYIGGNDALLFKIVENYMDACNTVFWQSASEGSYITKTVGIQALFDILRKRAAHALRENNLRREDFRSFLEPASKIDFADLKFRVPAGSGRSAIRKAIERYIHFDK